MNNTDIVFDVRYTGAKSDEVFFVVSLDDFSAKVTFGDVHRNV